MGYHIFALLMGRVFIGGIFILAGVEHFRKFQPPLMIMKARGVPYASLLLVIGSLWEIALGLFIVLGLWLALAAIGLALFLIPATIIFHNFWDHAGKDRAEHQHAAMANIMVAGGLIVLAGTAV
jgi:putative oxidoreductase